MASNKVHFFSDGIKFSLKDKPVVRQWIEECAKREFYKLKELGYIFCSDDALLEMNKTFLAHDTYTDIITFDNSEKKGTIVGEIYISIDRVKENATKFNVPFTVELHRVMAHGLMHLCGYKDKSKEDKELMRSKEDLCLANFPEIK